jgi:hypothetical protein
MRAYTTKEKAKITAGAVAALIVTGWLVVLTIAIQSGTIKEASNSGGRSFMIFARFQIIEGFFRVYVEMAADLKPQLCHLWIVPPFWVSQVCLSRTNNIGRYLS